MKEQSNLEVFASLCAMREIDRSRYLISIKAFENEVGTKEFERIREEYDLRQGYEADAAYDAWEDSQR